MIASMSTVRCAECDKYKICNKVRNQYLTLKQSMHYYAFLSCSMNAFSALPLGDKHEPASPR